MAHKNANYHMFFFSISQEHSMWSLVEISKKQDLRFCTFNDPSYNVRNKEKKTVKKEHSCPIFDSLLCVSIKD